MNANTSSNVNAQSKSKSKENEHILEETNSYLRKKEEELNDICELTKVQIKMK